MARALLVVDVQRGMFASAERLPYEGEAVVGRIASLLAGARAAAASIFFVQHDGGKGHDLSAGGDGFAFRPELSPREGEAVIVKRACSAFAGTSLGQDLKSAGVTHLVICGMQTEYCIDTAVRSAVERGFGVTLVADGHTTFDTPSFPASAIIDHHNRTLGDAFAELRAAKEIGWAAGPAAA